MASFFFVLGWTPSWHLLWSLPAYAGLTVALGGLIAGLSDRVSLFYRSHWRGVVVIQASIVLFAVIHAVCVVPGLPFLRETYGWDEAANLARSVYSSLPRGSFFLASAGRPYPAPSQLAFHLGKPSQVYGQNLVGRQALQYRFWARPDELAGKDAVVVVEGSNSPGIAQAALVPYFQMVEPPIRLRVPAGKFGSSAKAEFAIFVAHGYCPEKRREFRVEHPELAKAKLLLLEKQEAR
jgi:hypothetical protein